MPSAIPPDFTEWPFALQIVLQCLAHIELFLRHFLPPLIVLTGLGLLFYLSLLATREISAWCRWRRQTRLSRRIAEYQRLKAKIVGKGQRVRLRLACARQRKNLKEFALLVKLQLRTFKGLMPRRMVRRTSAYINSSIKNLDFDRLYCLHDLLNRTEAQQVGPRLEKFFRQVR